MLIRSWTLIFAIGALDRSWGFKLMENKPHRRNLVSAKLLQRDAQSISDQPTLSLIEEKPDNRKDSLSFLVTSSERSVDFDLVAILTIYFVQGALGLSRLAVTYFMKDELHLSPAELAGITGLTTLPWMIKPIYGFLSDGFPIWGYRRKSYLILSGILGFASWISFGTFVTTPLQVIISNILASGSVAISDVIADSLVVEKSRDRGGTIDDSDDTFDSDSAQVAVGMVENTMDSTALKQPGKSGYNSGDLQSLCWGAAAVGGILSSYYSGSLLEHYNPKTVFLFTAAFPLLVALVSSFISEEKIIFPSTSDETSSSSPPNTVSSGGAFSSFLAVTKPKIFQLYQTISSPSIYLPILFVCLYQATPSAAAALFYFQTNELKFQPEFLGRISFASSVASLLGVVAFRTWLKELPPKTVIFWSILASVPLGLTQALLTTRFNLALGIPDQAFALTDSVVLSVLGQISFMPTLVLASSLCPPGVEGTLFALLMSIYNTAGSVGTEVGALLTSFLGVTESNTDNLTLLVVICNLSSLLPLFFIGWLEAEKRKRDVVVLESSPEVGTFALGIGLPHTVDGVDGGVGELEEADNTKRL